MAARHRALARLNRHVPHVVGVDRRALSSRIGDREAEKATGPVVSGETVTLREVHERSLRGPVAGPNAPLLIRLVRHPYALHPVHPGRRPNTARPEIRDLHPAEREGVPSVREILESERSAILFPRPYRERAEAPPRPFKRRYQHDADTVPVGAE